MTDDELRRYLSAVDDPSGAVPGSFRDRLWAELEPVVARTAPPIEELPLSESEPGRAPTRRAIGPWLIAAAVVVLAGLAVLLPGGDEPDTATTPTTTAPTTTTALATTTTAVPPSTSLVASLGEVCTRFLDRTALLPVGTSPALDADVLEEYIADVAALRLDLEQFPDVFDEVATLMVIVEGSLAEAQRAFEEGDAAAADQSVSVARGRLSELSNRLEQRGGEPCLPAG